MVHAIFSGVGDGTKVDVGEEEGDGLQEARRKTRHRDETTNFAEECIVGIMG